MRCVASVSDGSAFTVTRLKSTTTDGQRVVDTTVSVPVPTASSFVWPGAALTSTSVEITAQLATKLDTATDAFTVESRIGQRQYWMSKSFPDIGFGAIPPPPAYVFLRPVRVPYAGFGPTQGSEGALGFTSLFYPGTPSFGAPRSGPNAGVAFVRNVPWAGNPNEAPAPGIYLGMALNPTDAFYKAQTGGVSGADTLCTQQQMASIAATVLATSTGSTTWLVRSWSRLRFWTAWKRLSFSPASRRMR